MRNIFILALLLMFCFSPFAVAQEVEFNIPTEINIVQGQLSVTFKDHVNPDDAKTLIQNLGYAITQESFPQLLVSATSTREIQEEEIRLLRQEHDLVNLSQRPAPENIRSIKRKPVEQAPKYFLTFTFPSNTSKDLAHKVLNELSITITRIEKKPNELVIDVGDQDAEAMSQLNGHEYIKYVTYMGEAGE